MKLKLFIVCLSALLFCNVYAQENDNSLSTINFSVILPSNVDGLNESNLSKLETKITEAVTNNGVSAEGYTQNFVIYPKFEIYDEKKSQGGMRSITQINCNLGLFIKQLSSNIIFSSYNKTLQGSGYSHEEALNNAIEQLNPNDDQLISFIGKAKNKIIAYYQSNCNIILAKAEAQRGQKNYESALSILLTVPEEATNCYTQAQAQAKVVFVQLQKANCSQYLQKAKAFAAEKDFNDALQYTSWIDATGPCASESRQLIASIASQVNEEQKKQWDFLLKRYTDKVALEKANIEAMNNLAIAWMKSQTGVISYTTIIK